MPTLRSSMELNLKKGKEIYNKVLSENNLGPSLARSNLQQAQGLYEKAQGLYEKALSGSRSSHDRASCYKALGKLNWLWAKREWKIYLEGLTAQKGKEGAAAAQLRITKCLEYCFQALHHGSRAKKREQWLTGIEKTLSNILEWSSFQLKTHFANFETVMRVLCEKVEYSKVDWAGRRELAVTLYRNLADFIYHRGIEYLKPELSNSISERGGYKKCLGAMRDCYQRLQRAEGILRVSSMDYKDYKKLVEEVRDLKKKVSNYEKLCEAIQSRIQGEELLEKAMRGDGETFWDAIDFFRASLCATEESQLEYEAVALEHRAIVLSRIGKVYSCVGKMKKAYTYHGRSIRIARGIMTERINSSDWYICSSEAVKKHKEQEKLNAVQAEGNKSAESFLKYIYENCPHPDVTKRAMRPLGSPEKVKTALKKAREVYHPDKNQQQSESWQALCEEITKILNNKCEKYQ